MQNGLISVPVLWNATGSFLNNQQITIDADTPVVGIAKKPSAPYPVGHPEKVASVDTVQVNSRALGMLFVNLTIHEYQVLVAQATIFNAGSATTITITVPGDIVANDAIKMAPIAAVAINDTIKNTGFTVSGDKLTFTDGTLVGAGDTFTIIYQGI